MQGREAPCQAFRFFSRETVAQTSTQTSKGRGASRKPLMCHAQSPQATCSSSGSGSRSYRRKPDASSGEGTSRTYPMRSGDTCTPAATSPSSFMPIWCRRVRRNGASALPATAGHRGAHRRVHVDDWLRAPVCRARAPIRAQAPATSCSFEGPVTRALPGTQTEEGVE
jgi:hypothetical protein